MPFPRLAATLLTLGAAFAAQAAPAACSLHLHDGWIASAPPVAPVRAGYLMIHNGTDTAVAIDDLSSPAFARVELHESVEVDGVSRMRPLAEPVVPGGGALTLAPGGLHLMLMEPVGPVAAGDRVELVVHACGREWPVVLDARSAGEEPAPADGHHHHHHGQ